jgi:spermidine synthase
VLGLGGGSLVPALSRLVKPETLIGVESDPAHLEVAREFFQMADFGVEAVLADAREWVEQWSGAPFDLVIEDLFAPSNRNVTRGVPAEREWCRALTRLVAPGGSLVMNFGDWPEYRHSWAATNAAQRGWRRGFRLSTPDCHNAVVCWLRRSSSSAELRRRVRAWPELDRDLDQGRLQYGIRRLF